MNQAVGGEFLSSTLELKVLREGAQLINAVHPVKQKHQVGLTEDGVTVVFSDRTVAVISQLGPIKVFEGRTHASHRRTQ